MWQYNCDSIEKELNWWIKPPKIHKSQKTKTLWRFSKAKDIS